ncbi:hypothetical protein [Collimonas sp.]|uniref:hypothetical protein n=1 Tax=Collimonas sp. TaxID=1963772 RepID=UPI002B6DB90A|nr:hypothetical protein [Collimonas sp.]HWW04166.1 hypothetical protein [Collimonas sp.]
MFNAFRRKVAPTLFGKILTKKIIGKIGTLSPYKEFEQAVAYDSITLIGTAQNGASDELQLRNVHMRSEGSALIQSLIGQTVELAIVESLTLKPVVALCAIKQASGRIDSFPIRGIKYSALKNSNDFFMPLLMNWTLASLAIGAIASIAFVGFCVLWAGLFKSRFNMDGAFSGIWCGSFIFSAYVAYSELLGFPLKLHRQIMNADKILK